MLENKVVKIKQSLFICVLTLGSFSWAFDSDITIGEMLKKLKRNSPGQQFQSVMLRESSVLPTANMPLGYKREHLDLDAIRPSPSRDVINVEKYGKDRFELEKITDRQINELFRLTEKMKNSPNRGELWLRLAELYVEKADYIRFRRQTEYEERLNSFNQKKATVKPSIDLADVGELNKKSIQLYEYFIRDFKEDPKMDQALYFLGFNYMELDDFKRGAAYYTRLVTEYPRSSYVGDAYFSIGEYYFDGDHWEKALDSYKKVIKMKESRLFGIAVYKAAWCHHRMGQSKEGLRYLEMLIRLGSDSSKKVNLAKLDDEARKDLVVFYVEGGTPEQAMDYFTRILGEKRAPKEVEKLAYYYSDKGEKDKAAYSFKQLISLDRKSPKAYEYQFQIVNNYLNVASSQKFKEELYVLIKDYGPHSDWRKENQSNKAVLETSYKTTEIFLKTYTLQHHQSAQNSHGKFSQQQAAEGYKLYLAEFQDSPNYPDMMFFYGELLYDMEKFGEAAQQYAWVAKNAPQSKYGSKAAMNMILGLEKNLPTEEQMQARVGQSTEPLELDPRVKQFVENGEWYLKSFQKADKNVELKFKIGRLYYLSNHFTESERLFKDLMQTHPKSKQAEYAANLLLDMYNLRKDYVGLERVGNEMLANSALANTTSAGQIKSILERASFKAGEDLEAKKDYFGSAKRYDEFAKKYPNSPLALKARFNAGVNYQRSNKIWPSIAAFEAVLKNQQKDAQPLHDKAIKLLPKMYQDLGMYQKAANSYVIAGEKNPDSKDSSGFFNNAAILYDALNSPDRAIKYYELYLKKAPGSERPDLYYRMAELTYRNKQFTRAINYYKEYLQVGREPELIVEAHFKIADCYAQLRNSRESMVWRTKVIAVQHSLVPHLRGPGAHYAAQIRLQNVEQVYNQLTALRFPADSSKLIKVRDQKVAIINQLNQEVAEIVKYDSSEEIVGALELLGRTNAHMGNALLGAPIPAEVRKDEAAKKQYVAAVADLARPFLAKALESYRSAVSKGREFDAYTQPYFAAIDAIAAMDPQHKVDLGQEAIPRNFQDWMGLK